MIIWAAMNHRTYSLLAVACLTTASLVFAADTRLITEVDLYNFRWIANPQISPDGTKVIYTLVKTTPKHDDYETSLWIIPSAGGPARQLTSGSRDSGARWSPDGKLVAFVRSTEKDGKPQPAQIYLLSMDGGEARPLTDVPKGAGEPVWSPDGRRIAFSSTTLAKDFDAKKDEPSDVRVITTAKYRLNGAGYQEADRSSHIWVVDVPKTPGAPEKSRQVTMGEFSEADSAWSHDSSNIYFTSNRVKEPDFQAPDSDIYVVSANGGALTKVASIDGPIHSLSLSPDGARIAFIGDINRDGGPARSFSQPDLFVTSTTPGSTPKNLTATYDFDIGGGVGGDQSPPRGGGRSNPYWSGDGRSVIVASAEQGRVNLKRVDAETGKLSALTDGNFNLFSYQATPDGSTIAALISTPTNIGDLFIMDGKSGHSQQITHVNGELFAQLNLTEPEMIWYKSFDGRRIQAWVQRPPDFQTGKKYPMILDIHGGPHSAYGYTFDHEFQWMAAKGYVVLYPNPRGSTSYGQEFGNIIQYHYPGDDFKDLMAGVDELIARGWVDPDKLGVTGGSGGGVLTNWTVGHTDRFKAAVSQRSIADWAGWWYGADMIAPSWFRGAPWEFEADFKERSPITYVNKVTTPLMLIEGESDWRTPPAYGGEQMFRALKYLNKTAVMVRFPGETHELSRSGKPVHRVERLRHIVAWFDKYSQGQEIHTYDLQ
jgi:dipeptidyl aminopeptidase/acylaminoacyl peptidase